MAKPRIIIADTDVNYIIPLQLKFVEDFFEKVDLEIITDEQYFETLFSTPQRAEILIVSEELYSQAMQRHNIAHIFVMNEQYEEDQTADLNINHIFKYTSIKEIFNEITGKSADVLKINSAAKQETQVILFYSASGGTGKTTTAMGVSASLTKNYKRVLYINAARLQVFHHMLDNHSSITAADVYAKLASASDNIYSEIKHVVRQELFSYLPPFKAALMSLGLNYSIFEKIISSAKKSGDYDFIVVDADITFDEDKGCILVCVDNANIPYSAPEILKNVRDQRHFMYFDDISNMKIFDVPLTIARNFKKPIEQGDGYYIKENVCLKLKTPIGPSI